MTIRSFAQVVRLYIPLQVAWMNPRFVWLAKLLLLLTGASGAPSRGTDQRLMWVNP